MSDYRPVTETSSASYRPGVDIICIGTTDNLVFSCLSPLDLIRFSLTCRKAYQSVITYNKTAYNIHHLLSRYFPDSHVDTFRHLQAKTGTLISGSVALQFFERLYYEESDLDLYLEAKHVQDLCHFIKGCGYIFIARDNQENDLDKAIALAGRAHKRGEANGVSSDDYYARIGAISSVLNFRKDGKTIQVISPKEDESVLSIILSFHSTCVMQIVSAQHAVSFYPLATFGQRRSLIMRTKRNTTTAIDKYASRGWEMLDENTYLTTGIELGYRWSDYGGRIRYVGDRLCWTVTLPSLSSGTDTLVDSYCGSMSALFMNSWRLEPDLFRMSFVAASQCHLGFGVPFQLLIDVNSLRKFRMIASNLNDTSNEDEVVVMLQQWYLYLQSQ